MAGIEDCKRHDFCWPKDAEQHGQKLAWWLLPSLFNIHGFLTRKASFTTVIVGYTSANL